MSLRINDVTGICGENTRYLKAEYVMLTTESSVLGMGGGIAVVLIAAEFVAGPLRCHPQCAHKHHIQQGYARTSI